MDKTNPQVPQRRHDLDALRAIAMLLGIVLHVSIPFSGLPWIIQDSEQHEVFGLIYYFLHGFRMQLFFVMSGFFTAMLWRRRGLKSMVRHRFQRVLLPFLLGVVTIVPVLNWLSGYVPVFASQEVQTGMISDQPFWVPYAYTPIFYHLWFLWFLWWLVVGLAVASLLLERLPKIPMPGWLVLSPVRYLYLIPLTMVPQAFMAARGTAAEFGPDSSLGLVPIPHVLAYYGLFFGFGALYYGVKDPDGRINKWWWLALFIGMFLVFPLGMEFSVWRSGLLDNWLSPNTYRQLSILFEALFPWLMIFGLMGLFGKIFSSESKRMRYISDSSYWLYLAHLPLVVGFMMVVHDWQLPAIVKSGFVLVVVSAILLVTYQTLVRYTWLGRLLNGPRKRPKKALAQATDNLAEEVWTGES